MSYLTISPGFSKSLLGAINPSQLTPELSLNPSTFSVQEQIRGARLFLASHDYKVILTITSGILVLTIFILYQVVQNAINNYFARLAINESSADKQDIERTLITNTNNFWTTVVFAVLAIFLFFLLFFAILPYIKNS